MYSNFNINTNKLKPCNMQSSTSNSQKNSNSTNASLHRPSTLLDLCSFVLRYKVAHLLMQTFTSLIRQLVEKRIHAIYQKEKLYS